MTLFGYFAASVTVFSLYIAYRIFNKVLQKKGPDKGEASFWEKGFVLFFIGLLMISINSIALLLSYTIFWEKAYRTLSETSYEAIVIGYQQETIKTRNFRNSSYHSKIVYFPKVKYTDTDGKEVIKTTDVASNPPPAIGESLKITATRSGESANTIELDWIILIFGGIFTGVAAFFASLLSTYGTAYTLKRRIRISVYLASVILILNLACVMLIYLKQ